MTIEIEKVKVNRTFTLPLTVAESLKDYAVRTRKDMSSFVAQAIVDALKKQETK